MAHFEYLDFVKQVLVAANARVPRLMTSAIRELGEIASKEVAQGNVVQNGDVISTADGLSPEDWVNFEIAKRLGDDGVTSHMEVPREVVEAANTLWLA
jgi:hypothetical protein